ncbi:MAG: hypothetical protein DMG16_30250 [Acidobacteria bacterium]|nr:MAG: hypothetical protein DMG16_30250 [Acidobacteriota bacterium]
MPGQQNAATRLNAKRFKQVLMSAPRYARELANVRDPRGLYNWFYYKLSYSFPLMDFPTRVNLEPTNDCNLGCRHCPRTLSVKQRGLGYLDPSLFAKITGEIAQHPGCIVKVVGLGEPALHPELGLLMTQLASHRIATGLYTNGELFKRFSPEEIITWNLQTIVISIEGLDAKLLAFVVFAALPCFGQKSGYSSSSRQVVMAASFGWTAPQSLSIPRS